MADETERFKPVPQKEGFVLIPPDATDEQLEAVVAAWKALDAKYKPIREAKQKEAEAAKRAEEAKQAEEAKKAAAQDASANTSSGESAAKEQG